MKKIISSLAVLFLAAYSYSQTLQLKQSYGSTGAEIGYSTHVDAVGNNYSGGSFTNTIVVGTDGESNFSLIANGSNSNGYLVKKQANGLLLWSAAFVGTGTCVVHSIATDASNNVFITGYFTGSIDFNPSPTINNSLTTLSNTNKNDIFVCKLTSSGAYSWAYRFGEINDDYGFDIAVDASGNVHVAGSFNTQSTGSGVIDFDPSPSASTMSSNGVDGFLLKLSNSGAYLAKQKMGSSGTDVIRSISIGTDSKLYATGYFSSAGFPGPNGATVVGAGLEIIVAKLETSNYTPIWQKGFGGNYDDIGYAIDTDGYGSLYIGGSYKGNVTLSTSFSLLNPSNVYYNGFIMKMNLDGNITWIKQLNGNDAGDIVITKLKADKLDNILLTGFFQGNIFLNPNSTTTQQYVSNGGLIDAFAIKMNQAGNLVGSPIVYASPGDDKAYSVATFGHDFYITGNFSGTVDADLSTTTNNLISLGDIDAFLVKYSETTCNAPTVIDTDVIPACASGNAVLSAQANFGTLSWYVNASGGSVQATGNTYSFAPGVTTTRYVSATFGACTSPRVAVQATVNQRPTITSSAPSFEGCAGNTITLETEFVNGTTGIVVWYDSQSSTTPLDTGLTFTTPILTASKTYYAEGNLDGCLSNSRRTISANITQIPTVTSVLNAGRCSNVNTSITIGATPSAGVIDWFLNNSGGAKVATGFSRILNITATTTNYAQANHNGCLSAKVPVTAYVSTLPVLTLAARGDTVCIGSTATLSASTTVGDIIWYGSGSNPLDTGNVFITPALSDTTTYRAEANNNFCVTAQKNTIAFTYPAISNAVTVSGPTLTAVETGATYQWASCGNKNSYTSVINGNNRTYTAQTSGSYAVLITKNGCKDTSACNNIIITALSLEMEANGLSIFPNPFNNSLEIELGENNNVSSIKVYNNVGVLVYETQTENSKLHINTNNWYSGAYIVELHNFNTSIVRKLILKD